MNAEHIEAELKSQLVDRRKETLRPPSGMCKQPYLIPGGYDQAWDWDSYFIAAALADWPEAHPHICGTIINFFEQMRDDGAIPRWIHPQNSFWNSSSLDINFSEDLAKPFFAQTALLYTCATGDSQWFKPFLEAEYDFLTLWLKRRMDQNGLCVWANGLESGGDNHLDVYGWPNFTVQGVDLAVFLIREFFATAILSYECGDYTLYQTCLGKGRFLLHQMNALLFDTQNNTYSNRYRPTGQFIQIRSQTRFYPFWLGDLIGMSASSRRKLLKEQLWSDTSFLSPHGLRSMSREDPGFNNTRGTNPSNWQGPIWIVGNYINLLGMIRAGMKAEATELAWRIQTLLLTDLQNRGVMSECYHSETGAPLAQGGFLSWNLLAADMLEIARTGTANTLLTLPSE